MTTRKTKDLFNLTEAAIKRVQEMLINRGKPSAGIRVGVRQKGCNGNAYTLEFADTPCPNDEMVRAGDITVFIDSKAVMFVVGTEMDYVDEQLQSGFVFRNPNEKGACGCGKSFYV